MHTDPSTIWVICYQRATQERRPGLTAIIGPNGAGKTTFFNLISGAIRPDKGRVTLAGEDIVGLPPAQIARRGVARSFQIASIFPSLTVEAILTATVQAHLRQAERIMRRFPLPECRERAFAAMDMLGLADKAAVITANLSHGDQKLLDIGLALVLEPRVLLLDEPTAGSMGSEERWQMIEKVRELWKRQNITLVFIGSGGAAGHSGQSGRRRCARSKSGPRSASRARAWSGAFTR